MSVGDRFRQAALTITGHAASPSFATPSPTTSNPSVTSRADAKSSAGPVSPAGEPESVGMALLDPQMKAAMQGLGKMADVTVPKLDAVAKLMSNVRGESLPAIDVSIYLDRSPEADFYIMTSQYPAPRDPKEPVWKKQNKPPIEFRFTIAFMPGLDAAGQPEVAIYGHPLFEGLCNKTIDERLATTIAEAPMLLGVIKPPETVKSLTAAEFQARMHSRRLAPYASVIDHEMLPVNQAQAFWAHINDIVVQHRGKIGPIANSDEGKKVEAALPAYIASVPRSETGLTANVPSPTVEP